MICRKSEKVKEKNTFSSENGFSEFEMLRSESVWLRFFVEISRGQGGGRFPGGK